MGLGEDPRIRVGRARVGTNGCAWVRMGRYGYEWVRMGTGGARSGKGGAVEGGSVWVGEEGVPSGTWRGL